MAQMNHISKALIVIGTILICSGVFWHFFGTKFPLFRLPGDIRIESENAKFYFPITLCIIISLILSAISWFFKK